MKINNKGFSFVEILAVIMIIGILTSIAVVGITRYRTQAENKNYEALAKSSYAAMEEYLMTNNYSKPISLEKLEKENFLSNRLDPVAKNRNCTGSVEYENTSGSSDVIDSGIITVYLCCSNYKRKYTYPEGKVEIITETDKCMSEGAGDIEDDDSITCSPGNYLPQSSNDCRKCPANYYCPGGTFYYDDNKEQGKNKCSSNAPGYSYSNEGSDAINDCYINVPENKYIKKAKDEEPTNCSSGNYKDAHTVKFGKISSCEPATIEVTFDCNGGTLDSGLSTATYQSDVTGQKFTTKCKRTGYTQDGWKRNKTATSSNYTTDSNVTENFILTNKPRITLYAHWKPKVIKVNLSLNNPISCPSSYNAGTQTIYLKYGDGWYSNSTATTKITKITKPDDLKNTNSYLVDYKFNGYYTIKNDTHESADIKGKQIIDGSGNFISGNTTEFSSDSTIYALWLYQGWNLTNALNPISDQKWEYYSNGEKAKNKTMNLCTSNYDCPTDRIYVHYFDNNGIAQTGWKKIGNYIYFFRDDDGDGNGYLDLIGLRDMCKYIIPSQQSCFDANSHCISGSYCGGL